LISTLLNLPTLLTMLSVFALTSMDRMDRSHPSRPPIQPRPVPMSSKSSSSHYSSGLTDDHPLISIPKPSLTINVASSLPTGDGEARGWPCAPCGILLGLIHFTLGFTLLLFDILTNTISHTAFGVTASLTFIICSLLCFIAVRRVDRCAQVVLMCFSTFSLVACISIFLESSVQLNARCTPTSHRIQRNTSETEFVQAEEWNEQESGLPPTPFSRPPSPSSLSSLSSLCDDETHAVLSALIAIALTEMIICLITLIVCFRSLHSAYAVGQPSSPYSTLIVGDLNRLKREAPKLEHRYQRARSVI
ncbi:hypothetical protein PENTCL1PPCAC_6894, partial [Pristionchus entomophagus]